MSHNVRLKTITAALLLSLGLAGCGSSSSDNDPVTEDPVTEDPVTEDPVTEDPVTEDPTPDTTAPSITLLGDESVTWVVGETLPELGVTITDNVDTDVELKSISLQYHGVYDSLNELKASLSSNTPNDHSFSNAVYGITYIATDAAGNQTSKTRDLRIINPIDLTGLYGVAEANFPPASGIYINVDREGDTGVVSHPTIRYDRTREGATLWEASGRFTGGNICNASNYANDDVVADISTKGANAICYQETGEALFQSDSPHTITELATNNEIGVAFDASNKQMTIDNVTYQLLPSSLDSVTAYLPFNNTYNEVLGRVSEDSAANVTGQPEKLNVSSGTPWDVPLASEAKAEKAALFRLSDVMSVSDPLLGQTRDKPYAISFWLKTAESAGENYVNNDTSSIALAQFKGCSEDKKPIRFHTDYNKSSTTLSYTPIADSEVSATANLYDDNWHMVLIEFMGNHARVSIDNVSTNSSIQVGSLVSQLGEPENGYYDLFIGGIEELTGCTSLNRNYAGYIDEVRVYDRHLNMAEEAALFEGKRVFVKYADEITPAGKSGN